MVHTEGNKNKPLLWLLVPFGIKLESFGGSASPYPPFPAPAPFPTTLPLLSVSQNVPYSLLLQSLHPHTSLCFSYMHPLYLTLIPYQ